MKTVKLVLFICLFLLQSAITFAAGSVKSENLTATEKTADKKPANVYFMKGKTVTRSLPEMLTGYIEDGQLYIYFNEYVQNQNIIVIDNETGEVIYSGAFTGNILVIPLTGLGEFYTVQYV